MTSDDVAASDAAVHVPSLLTRIMTLTRCAGISLDVDDLKASFELMLRSSGGGVNDDDDDFSTKLNESLAYIRLRGGKSDSSSVSDGLGVTNPFGSPMSVNLRFSECNSSDFCKDKSENSIRLKSNVGS